MRSLQRYLVIHRRAARRQQHAAALQRTGLRLAAALGIVLSLALVAAALLGGFAYANLTRDLPSLAVLPALLDRQQGLLLQPTRLYDRSGQQLLYTLENPGIPRHFLTIDPQQEGHFSPYLIQGVIALHDPGFWRHAGFLLDSLNASQPQTIAERVVDELVLWREPDSTARRLRLRLLAAQAVSEYGRAQVLEWYLNSAWFGHLAYGADAAARLYLGKSAEELNLAESALLLAALEAPALNPLDAPTAALERKDDVLNRLLALGVIQQDDYQRALAEPLTLADPPEEIKSPALAFSRLVVDQLARQYGIRRLERGGLRVVTTLDAALQRQTYCTLAAQLNRLAGDLTAPPDDCLAARFLPALPGAAVSTTAGLAASAVMLDPQSGEVLALVGNASAGGESAALTGHTPGSVLSPFVALAAFTYDFSPATLVWDIPSSLPAELTGYLNLDGKFRGPLRLRMAVAGDALAALAGLAEQLGRGNVWRLAEVFGFSSLQENVPGELLYGGGDVTLLEVAQAYATIANLGVQTGLPSQTAASLQPVTVLLVEEVSGATWFEHFVAQTKVVILPQYAYLAHHILADESARRQMLGFPNPFDIGRPAAGKAAQAEGGSQVWAVGYTPQRLAVTWFGAAAAPQENARLDVKVAAGVWYALIQVASRDLPATGWQAPAGITTVLVCDPSGALPSRDCPTVVNEVFLVGREPATLDALYRTFEVNRETGRLATVFTAPELVEARTYLVVPPEAAEWARLANLPVPPDQYDIIQPPPTRADVRIATPAFFSYVHGEISIRGSASGEDFAFYRLQVGEGLNPRAWLQIGEERSIPVTNGLLATWDTAGREGLYMIRLQVVRSDQRVDTAIIQVTVDNTPPRVRILSPLEGETFRQAATRRLNFTLETEDAIGIRRVEWYVDGKSAAVVEAAPYAYLWDVRRGTHTVKARVTDLAGNSSETAETTFTVE